MCQSECARNIKTKVSKRPCTLCVVVRTHIRLKIFKPVPSENVDPKAHTCWCVCLRTCTPAYLYVKQRQGILYSVQTTPKKATAGRESTVIIQGDSEKEKIKKREGSLEAEPANYSAAHLHLFLID